jgi:hypothetical protein
MNNFATRTQPKTAKNPSQITQMNINFISGINKTIHLSKELLKKDISNFETNSKDKLIKIHESMYSIIEGLTNVIDTIDNTKLTSTIRENLKLLNNNLKILNDMCNGLYKKDGQRK